MLRYADVNFIRRKKVPKLAFTLLSGFSGLFIRPLIKFGFGLTFSGSGLFLGPLTFLVHAFYAA